MFDVKKIETAQIVDTTGIFSDNHTGRRRQIKKEVKTTTRWLAQQKRN